MPVAAVAGAAMIGGAAIASSSANKASKLQQRSASEALAMENQRYQQSLDLYKRQWDVWQANRRALLRRYGINMPDTATIGPAAAPGAVAAPPVAQAPGMVPPAVGRPAVTLRDLAGVPRAPVAPRVPTTYWR